MAFTVQDFQDLLRLLDQHPEWQAELRRRVLTDDLLEVPSLLRRLTEAQARTDENIASITQRLDTLTARVDALADAQVRTDEHIVALTERLDTLTARVDGLTQRLDALTARVDTIAEQLAILTERVDALTERMDALTERVDALTERVDALTERMDALTERMDALTERMDALATRVDANTDELLELRYERRAGAYFGPLARRIRVLDRSALADMLDDEVDQGRMSEAERRDVLQADLVLSGQRREDRADVFLVVEVSFGIGTEDVRRAADRASVLSRLGRPVIPVVAGERIDPEPARLAGARGVSQVLDGRAPVPGEAAS